MYCGRKLLKIGYFLYALVGVFFVFCWITGRELANNGNILWNPANSVRILLESILVGSFLGILFGALLYRLIQTQVLQKRIFATNLVGCQCTVQKESLLFLGCLTLIFLSWLPYFLAYFPGICAYDAVTQIGQIETGEYVEHHPLAHTLWIRACLFLGKILFGSANGGVALYTVLQMLFLAAAFSYGIVVMNRYRVKKSVCFLFFLFSSVYPFHGFLSISMTKDIIFSGFCLFQMLFLFQLLVPGENRWHFQKKDLLFCISCIGMICYRNNGKYALLVLVFFLVLAVLFGKRARKLWTRLLGNCIFALLIGNVLLFLLSSSVNAVQGDKREMLSMPIQQLARCMLYHGDVGVLVQDDGKMTQEDKDLIRDLFREDGYLLYMPHISDPVKAKTVTSVVRFRPKEFLKSYFRLLKEFPGEFINAALELNAGYLFPEDTSHSTIYQEIYPGMEGKGYVQTQWWESVVEKTGVTHATLLPRLHARLEKWADSNAYLKIPVLKYLFVPGIWIWWYLILIVTWLVKKEYRKCLLSTFLFGYFMTLFLAPVVQLRYLYPVMIMVPFLTILPENVMGEEKGEARKQ